MECKVTKCKDIFLRNSSFLEGKCPVKNKRFFTSLISRINCWIEEGEIDLSSASSSTVLVDNGNGTSNLLVDGVLIGVVVTTATDVQLVDNRDGTANLVVNGVNLGSVITATPIVYTLSAISATNTFDLLADGIAVSTIDLSAYLDDTNIARIISAVIDATGLVTFTRDDATTLTLDLSSLIFTLDDAVANSTTPTGVVFNGTGAKVATFNGDIDVVGTIDPDGILYTTLADVATAITHFTGKGYDFSKITWINATNGHFYRGNVDLELQSATSAFRNESDNLPTTDQTVAKYTEGLNGFGETDPEENIDLVGTMKTEHQYGDGSISRNQLGSENMLSELGVPSGLVKGNVMEFLAAPASVDVGLKLQMYQGDFSAISPIPFTAGLGMSNVAGNYYSRVHTFRSIDNPNGYLTTLDSREGADRARVSSFTKGLDNKNQEAMNWFRVESGGGRISDIRQSPHELNINTNLVVFQEYGLGNKIEGFTNTDDVANTGSAATVIGSATYLAGFDSNGNFMESPIVFNRETIVLTQTELNTLATSQVTLIPSQGVGTVIKVTGVTARLRFGTVPYNYTAALNLRYDGDSTNIATFSASVNNGNVDIIEGANSLNTVRQVEDTDVIITVDNGNPTQGDSEIDLYITYEIIQL